MVPALLLGLMLAPVAEARRPPPPRPAVLTCPGQPPETVDLNDMPAVALPDQGGCSLARVGQEAEAEGDVDAVAWVNGRPVTREAFDAAWARTTGTTSTFGSEPIATKTREEVVAQLVDDELLYQHALGLGLDQDPKVQKVMVNTLLREEVYSRVQNSDFDDAQLRAYYEANEDEFVVPEKLQLKTITVKITDERGEDEALDRAITLGNQVAVDPSGTFKDVAATESEDPYRRRGGDVGFVSRDGKPGFSQEIVEKAFTMQVGEVSRPVRTADAWVVVYVANRRERVERTFEQMKGSVLRKVKNDRLRELYEQYTADLREGATIELVPGATDETE